MFAIISGMYHEGPGRKIQIAGPASGAHAEGFEISPPPQGKAMFHRDSPWKTGFCGGKKLIKNS